MLKALSSEYFDIKNSFPEAIKKSKVFQILIK